MLALTRRRKARDRFTDYLEGTLSAREAAWMDACLAADAPLRDELRRFEAAVGDLHRLSAPSLPDGFTDDLAITMALASKPLRERYSDVIDGLAPASELASLRREINADPELAAEFALLEAAMVEAHRLPPVAAPAGLAAAVRRRIAAERPTVVAPRRATVGWHLRPQVAWACAAATFVLGLWGGARFLGDGPNTTAPTGNLIAEIPGPRPVLSGDAVPVSAESGAAEPAPAEDVEIEVTVPATSDGKPATVKVATSSDGSVALQAPPETKVKVRRYGSPRPARQAPRRMTQPVSHRPAAPTSHAASRPRASAPSRPAAAPARREPPPQPVILDEAGLREFRQRSVDASGVLPPPEALNAIPAGGAPDEIELTYVTAPGFE